jgi:hypothetical protein
MKHTARIKAIEQKVGDADESTSIVIRYIHSETGELLREDKTRTAGYKGKPAVVIADEDDMRL